MNRNESDKNIRKWGSAVKEFLLYYSIPRDELKKVEPRIRQRNSRTLKIFSVICAALFVMLVGMSLTMDGLKDNLFPHIFALAGVLIVAVYEWFFVKQLPNLQTPVMYLFLTVLNVFAIALGTYASPDNLAVTYIALILGQSMLFIDRPARVFGFQIGSMIVFTLVAPKFESGNVLFMDVGNVWILGSLSLFTSGYTMVSQSRRYLTEYRLENLGIIDQLTGLRNRNCYEEMLPKYPHRAKYSLACVYMDVNGLHALNDEQGHEAGDRMLQFMAFGFQKAFGEKDSYRIGGDEFVAIPMDMGVDEIREKISVLLRTYAKRDYHAAIGYAFTGVSRMSRVNVDMMQIVKTAEENMYREKEIYYRNVGFDSRSQRDAVMALKEQGRALAFIEIDDLTGLYTRQAFYHHVQIMLRRNPDIRYNLVVMDIDNFKSINERFGEETGDRILRKIGNHIKAGADCSVYAGRYSSDIFVILMEQGEKRTEEMVSCCYQNMMKDPDIQRVTFKFGIYEDVEHTVAVSVLCDRAMTALRSIKGQYGVISARYDEKLRKKIEWEHTIEETMEAALSAKQFQVYYQPKHDAATGSLIGAEALIRWFHPEYGFISPGEFIPIFEKNGFITKADYFVWNNVCCDLRRWMDEGLDVVPISVNASKLDFAEADYWERLHTPLKTYGIDQKYLHIEVTETLVSGNVDVLVALLKKLRDEGFKIEMDDFGKGYSSLNTLGTLPLDIVKLDMSFINQIEDSRKYRVLSSVISLARNLSLETVAEGVETQEQLDVLRDLGCDGVQGYYFSKPLPAEEFRSYICRTT